MSSTNDGGGADSARAPTWALATVLGVGAWFVVTHVLHVFTEAINWDEFALLDRAARTLATGHVEGAGRPGLVSIWLIPFVRGCVNSVQSAVNARLLWQAVTLAYLLGVYVLVRRWFAYSGRSNQGRIEGMLAVALLAFIPAFVTWSVQVRTDQPALAAATWGGIFLLSSGYLSAALAGVLFGLALLCTQKALYVIALCGVLFVTAMVSRVATTLSPWRDEVSIAFRRTAMATVLAIAVVGLYASLVPSAAKLVSGAIVANSMDTMNWYREQQGYRIYTVHASRLVVHWVLFATMVIWTVRVILRREKAAIILMGTCWAILFLGLFVAWVHGSRLPYFWMTAGLFLSISLAMASGGTIDLAGRMKWPIIISLIALAALQSAPQTLEMFEDTQSEQRETIRLAGLLSQNGRRGYSVEGATFCYADPEPLPVMFAPQIWGRFRGDPEAAETFINEFRDRPVAYIIDSFRLRQFPGEVRNFWSEHYIWYARSLFVAGFFLEISRDSHQIDVIVPGRYRWSPESSNDKSGILVDSRTVSPSGEISLGKGLHKVELSGAPVRGSLILADLPAADRDGYPSFYPDRQHMQISGWR